MRGLVFLLVLFFITSFGNAANVPLPSGYQTHEIYKIKTDLDIAEAAIDATELIYDNSSTVNADVVRKVIRVTYSATDDGNGGSVDGTGTSDYDSGIDLPAFRS